MALGRLPSGIEVNGAEYPVRTDYRDILQIFEACQDPELTNSEKLQVMLTIFYQGFAEMPADDYKEALRQAQWFIDCGREDTGDREQRKLLDWEQDERLIFPAVNKIAGQEVRALEYLHWWTFMGYFMEIEEGMLSTVLGIRQKKAKRKPLEKWEREFYANNKSICDLRQHITARDQEELDFWEDLLKEDT